jgi:hypothetical protein
MTGTNPVPAIDLSRDALLSESAMALFRHYMRPGETSPQQVLMRAALRHSTSAEEAQRLYDAASTGQFAFSSSQLRQP